MKTTMLDNLKQHDREAILDAPTLAGLAGATRRSRGDLDSPQTIPLRSAGSRRPLFLLHEGFGGLVAYDRLSGLLDRDIPIHGVEAKGLHETEPVYLSVEAMAADYTRQIKAVQPRGPYRLAGWSVGGILAYEVANQLLGRDDSVEFIGLIDTYHMTTQPAHPEVVTPEQFLIRTLEYVAPTVSQAALQDLWHLGALDSMIERCHRMGWLASSITADVMRRRCQVANHLTAAAMTYFPPALPLDVLLLTAEEPRRDDPTNGWAELLGQRLRVVPLPGTHLSIMRDDATATRISGVLNQALLEAERPLAVTAPGSNSQAFTLQRGRAGRVPVLCVPGAGSSAASFASLAQAFDPDTPIHGLQPRGLDGIAVPHADVAVAARSYLGAIRDLVPRGPYRLLGHSFGGWIALEIARQLRADGQRVDPVAVLDADPPTTTAAHPGLSRAEVLDQLIEVLEQAADQSLSLCGADLAQLAEHLQLEKLRVAMVRAGLLSPRVGQQPLKGMLRVFAANVNTSYAPPGPFDGDVVLIQASEDRNGPADIGARAAAWARQARHVHTLSAPGNHMSILRLPHVTVLAALIKNVWEASSQ